MVSMAVEICWWRVPALIRVPQKLRWLVRAARAPPRPTFFRGILLRWQSLASRVVFAACGGHRGCDDPPPSAMPGPGSSWQSLAPPCPHSRSAQVRAHVKLTAPPRQSWQSLAHLRVLENAPAEHASPSCAGASPAPAACNHARSADSGAGTGARTY